MSSVTAITTPPTYVADRQVGRVIAGMLGSSGAKQRDLAKAIPLDGASLSRSIKGERRWNLSELLAIAEYFEVPIAALFEDPDQLPPARMLAVRAIRCTEDRHLTLVAA